MPILITNDDSYAASGRVVLPEELATVACASALAPECNNSDAGKSPALARSLAALVPRQTGLTRQRGTASLPLWRNAL